MISLPVYNLFKGNIVKIFLYLIVFFGIVFPFFGIAQSFDAEKKNYFENSLLLPEETFSLSEESIQEWKDCHSITSKDVFELCLQKDVANATVKNTELLLWQTLIALLTLFAAIAAALFSAFAARQAYRGVALAMKVGATEIRPYIEIGIKVSKKDKPSESKLGSCYYDVTFSFKNIGKTEAFEDEFVIDEQEIDRKIEFLEDVFNIERFSNGSFEERYVNSVIGENNYIHPKHPTSSLSIGISNPRIEKTIIENKDYVHVFILEYRDALGTKYQASCAYRTRFVKSLTDPSGYEISKGEYIKFQQDTVLETPKIDSWVIN